MEVGDVPFDTKEFNFTRYLNKSREHFTGRRWLYSELESILSDSQGNIVRGVVVIGKPGVGKSALSAQLICSRASSPYIHKRIIGYHLCKYSDKATQDPGLFVRNLVDLIARRIPEYGMLIYNSSFIPRVLQTSCLRDPYDCFEQAIAIPLSQVKNERQYYFIIMDALDECASDSAGSSLIQFVKDTYNRLPKWVRLVMTSRNDSAVLSHFDSFPKVHLSSSDARNLQDIEIFIASKLFEDTPFLERAKVILGLGSSDEVTYLTNKLLTQSEGNFLFAKLMLQYGKDDWHNQADLNKLPKTVGEQYERYLRRAYGSREKFKPALAILEILVATSEPLKANHIFDVLRIQEKMDFEYDFVYALKGLSHFVTYGEDNTITLFHQTFREWLTSKDNLGSPYYVSRSRGHRRLVEYYINVLRNNSNSSMDIYRLAQHISFGEERDHYLDDFRNIKASYVNATIDNDNRTLLHLSASESNRKALQILSEAFEDIDCEDSYGFTPAFVAAINGQAENVAYLLSKGANIEHRTKAPPPPSYVWGDPIARSKTSFWNSTMMHAAASGGHNDIVRLLLTKNSSFTEVNGVNLTAIQLAAENGHLEVVQVLHKHGAQLDHLSLQHAAFRGHANVVAYLLKFGVEDTCLRCDGSFYWLQNRTRYQAASLDHSNNALLTDDKFKIFCQSALHLAVAKNHIEVAQLLLSQEYKAVHCIDFTGRTPLHEAVRQNHVEIAELVIMSGAKISHNCSHFQNLSSVGDKHHLSFEERKVYSKDICHCGSTPFHLSARYGHVEVGTLLLRHGAKSDSMDCQGATPLHVAACHGHYSFIKWLISQRPSLHINTRSKNQSTLLHSAAICKNNQRVKPLIDMGASAYDTDEHGMTPLHYTVLNAFDNIDFVLLETSSWFDPIFVWGSKGDFTFMPDSKHFVWGSKDDFTFAHDSKPITREVPIKFQCLKLLEIVESTDDSFINQVDENGTTALHLAAKNGEECCVMELLEKGARADVTDDKDRTPLDLAINSTPKEMHCRPYETERKFSPEFDNKFDFHRAVNLRYHNSVANILLFKEAYSARKCDGTQTYLLHRAFEKEKPFIADTILSKGGLLSCKDKQGRTPLLIYLQNGGKWLDVVLKRFNVTITIECNKHFNVSEFHLVAFRKATASSENLLEQHKCDSHECYIEDGPLAKAIKNHPLGFRVIDECRDAEGYTALHRAAQGGNLLVLKKFIFWGANPNLLTPQGYSALHLAIMSGIRPFSSFNARRTAEKAADVLLQATRHISAFDVGCNSAKMSLTVYHLSAYGGLTDFVNTLLNSRKDLGVDVNCSNVNGITPLYLAKLHVGTQETGQSKRDPWQEIVNLIEENGGRLTYPNRDVELNVLYKHLFGGNLNPFVLDQSELPNKLFFKSLATQCRQHDLQHYGTGSLENPFEKKIHHKILQLISSLNARQNRLQLVPRDSSRPYTTRKTLVAVEKASSDLSRLLSDFSALMESNKDEIIRRRNDTKISRDFYVNSKKLSLSDKKKIKEIDNQLREMHFQYESLKAIDFHRNLKEILHKHSGVLGEEETSITRNLLERSEESVLCMDEIFQAKFMILKFRHYILDSRTEDLLSSKQHTLYRAEITSRIPVEWKMADTNKESIPTWNLAVKFLYRLATQRDLAFNYLQVLSLGLDKDTRIPLSVDALYSLWLEN